MVLLLAVSSYAQSSKSGIQVTDLLKIKDVGNIILSPTEDFAIFSLRSVVESDRKGEYDYQNNWWIVRFEPTISYRPLTSGKEGFGSPTISPDGKKILFTRAAGGRSQLFVMHLDGGDPIQLTDLKYGASSPTWSPDGKRIVFSAGFSLDAYIANSEVNPGNKMPPYSLEKPGFEDNSHLLENKAKLDPNGTMAEIRAYLAQNEKERRAKVINKSRFQGERSVAVSYNVSQLFVIDADGKSNLKQLTYGYNSFGGVQFKDNNTIWVSGTLASEENPERGGNSSAIYSINLNTGDLKEVVSMEKNSVRLNAISPDGNTYVYSSTINDSLVISKLHIVTVLNGKRTENVLDLDRQASRITFDPTGQELYLNVSRNGGSVLYKYTLKTGKLDKLTSDDLGINAYAVAKNRIIYSQTDINNPSELYVADRNVTKPVQVTDFNSSWLKDRQLVPVEKYTFTNELGLEVEYWVMKPLNFKEGEKYPLLLQIHGGPASMWGPGVSSMWHEYQYFAAQGYGIVYSNPRGSSGYGVKFLQGNYRDWGNGPMSDVLTALDKTVAQGWADPKKLLISGGSYAGYLTSWIISHDNRFLAASAQRGVYHLTTFYGEGNASSLVPRYYGGYPWESEVRKILEEQSPYNYVDKINTPFLIFHGEVDLRTGVIQSEMMYKSLKQLNKPVEYVRHPGGDHELTRSGDNRQRIDQMLRTYEFFERYVKSAGK